MLTLECEIYIISHDQAMISKAQDGKNYEDMDNRQCAI